MGHKLRNVAFILLGVRPHMLSGSYSGPHARWVHSYASNISISFALFFLLQFVRLPGIRNPFACAGYALIILFVEEFAERLPGYPGVFDPWDLLYDAIGVAVALGLDKIVPATPGQKKEETG